MPVFAVSYTYDESHNLDSIRPIHREYLAQLLERGILLASGPFVGSDGALLIIRAEGLEEVADHLDKDPFDIAGFITERAITEWNPVFGPWSKQ